MTGDFLYFLFMNKLMKTRKNFWPEAVPFRLDESHGASTQQKVEKLK